MVASKVGAEAEVEMKTVGMRAVTAEMVISTEEMVVPAHVLGVQEIRIGQETDETATTT